MKPLHTITLLTLLLAATAPAFAQERGDGEGIPATKDPYGIISGRSAPAKGSAVAKEASKWASKNRDNATANKGKSTFTPGTFDFGVKLGATFQQLQHSPFATQFTPGIIGGAYFRRYWRTTAIKVELLASTAHYTSTRPPGDYAAHAADTTTKSQFRTIYFAAPAVGQLRVYRHVFLEGGVQYSYLLSSTDKNGVFTKLYGQDNIFKPSEFSALIGVEVILPQKFKADVRFVKGLTDVNNSVYPQAYMQWNVNSIQATISYRLFDTMKK